MREEQPQAAGPDALVAGARLFDAEAWFEAHEVWEARWAVVTGAERELLQGLIQAAAALLQRQRGVEGGAWRLWQRGRAHLLAAAAVPGSRAEGLALAPFIAAMDRALEAAAAPPRLLPLLREPG